MLKFLTVVFGATISLLGTSYGDDWPNRPLKLIVPTAAGSATDITARMVANGVAPELGQAVVVINVPGVSGIVAHESAARAAPDGYTFLFTNTSGMATNLISFKQLPYDPTRDFTAVSLVCSLGPQMLSVKSDLPVHDIGELIVYTKANPGKLSIAFDNTAGAAAYAAKLLNKRAGLNLVEVPYRSSPQAVQDTSAGVAQLLMSSIAAARPGVESGKLRRLAVTSRRRFPGLPELPSLQERVPGVVMDGFFAVVAPTGTASEIVKKMNVAIGHYLAGSEIRDRLLAFGLATDGGGTPENTAQLISEEQKYWRMLATELSIEPQ